MSLKVEKLGKKSFATIFRYALIMPDIPPDLQEHMIGGTFPFFEFTASELRAGNFVRKFPSQSTLSDVEMVFYENEGGLAWKWFHNWRSQIVNVDGSYNLPEGKSEFPNQDPEYNKVEGYKKSFTINALDTNLLPIFGIKYTGAWPMRISDYSPSGENREILQFTVTLSVDGAYPQQTFLRTQPPTKPESQIQSSPYSNYKIPINPI
jgi:hypothetical protein